MRAPRSPVPQSVSETTRPETDFEHQQRYLNDIDRSTWRGEHAPAKGPRAQIHKMSVAENVPHIYKPA
jgi:hypothetical protein